MEHPKISSKDESPSVFDGNIITEQNFEVCFDDKTFKVKRKKVKRLPHNAISDEGYTTVDYTVIQEPYQDDRIKCIKLIEKFVEEAQN